jgi:hypothetical protein
MCYIPDSYINREQEEGEPCDTRCSECDTTFYFDCSEKEPSLCQDCQAAEDEKNEKLEREEQEASACQLAKGEAIEAQVKVRFDSVLALPKNTLSLIQLP